MIMAKTLVWMAVVYLLLEVGKALAVYGFAIEAAGVVAVGSGVVMAIYKRRPCRRH